MLLRAESKGLPIGLAFERAHMHTVFTALCCAQLAQLLVPVPSPTFAAAALQQPQQGQNLTYLAAGNWLRGLGIESQPEINRILVRGFS